MTQRFGFPLISLCFPLYLAAACGAKTQFSNNTAKPVPPGSPGPTTQSAGAEGVGKKDETPNTATGEGIDKLLKPASPETCSEEFRALRVAFVVDNTESNSCSPGQVQDLSGYTCKDGSKHSGEYSGTDPIKSNHSNGRGHYTERQNAVYESVLSIMDHDAKAIAKDPNFPGSAVGVVSFPEGQIVDDSLDRYVKQSGKGPLPKLMTNLKGIASDDVFKNSLWDMLKFTHNPVGMTPYNVAFRGAKELLMDKQAGDSRPEIVFFITDGLPTDSMPSKIVEARKSLGSTPVIFFNIYSPGASSEAQNGPAKNSLQELWNSAKFSWGHEASGNDNFPNFDAFWTRLQSIQKEVGNTIIEVRDPKTLKLEIDKALGVLQVCKK